MNRKIESIKINGVEYKYELEDGYVWLIDNNARINIGQSSRISHVETDEIKRHIKAMIDSMSRNE